MMKYSIPVFAVLLVIGVLVGSYHTLDPEQRAQAQTGVIDLLPYKAYIPIARKAPPPSHDWIVTRNYHLTPCENHGMLRLKITVFDKNGQPLNGIKVVRYTSIGDYAGEAISGDKGPGKVEFTFEGPDLGGCWYAYIDVPGETSEWATNLCTNLPDEECEATGEPGNSFKHHSYDVDFRRTK